MELNREAPYLLGVDLGGTNVRAAVADREGKLLTSSRASSLAAEGVGRVVEQIALVSEAALAELGVGREQVAGLGIGVPGVIEPRTGVVLWAPNFYEEGRQYRNVAMAEPVARRTGLPVFLGNDANVAALGEYRFGAGRAVRTMVMLTLGTGIGGGIVLNGRLWTGATGGAGEIGHIIVAAGARGGDAAFGSLESLGQISAIVERVGRKLSTGRPSLLAERTDYDWRLLTPRDIALAAAEGDAVARETFEETGYYIGLGVASLVNLLNPELVVIGGGVAQAGDLILEPIRRSARANAIKALIDVCRIVPAALGDDAGVLGGVSLVLDALEGR